MRRPHPRAFTLVELLVVIAIIGVLVAMMLPAVQASREVARRTRCLNNLTQLSAGLQNYQMAHQAFPSGTIDPAGPIRSVASGDHRSWVIPVLPFIGELNTYRHIDQSVGVYHANNALVRAVEIGQLNCPSEANGPWSPPQSNYAGVHHDAEAPIDATNHGVLFLNSKIRPDDISDGLAHTLFLGEKIGDASDLGWMSGTRATLRNTGGGLNTAFLTRSPADAYIADIEEQPDGEVKPPEPVKPPAPAVPPTPAAPSDPALAVGGFASYHNTGVNFAFGDGSVRFIAETINDQILQQLAHRADGKLLPKDN
jgi:prepilin-type N-terminal cleavage/methylation domain-containing protein/prepilin-type processing-associated H-X9-DG protein